MEDTQTNSQEKKTIKGIVEGPRVTDVTTAIYQAAAHLGISCKLAEETRFFNRTVAYVLSGPANIISAFETDLRQIVIRGTA